MVEGHRLLLAALSQLQELPNWICWMVGGARRAPEVSYEAEFLGERARCGSLLAAADIGLESTEVRDI
jgi:hypothetical protein